MLKKFRIIFFAVFGLLLGASGAFAGTLAFSAAERLATLPWTTDTQPGIPSNGPDELMVDSRGRYWIEENRDFAVYSPKGHAFQTVSPIAEGKSFFGFSSMEPLADGRVALLERLETPRERQEKINFEVLSKPGADLILLNADGTVDSEKAELDPGQPHSKYFLENGGIYSVHDDGTFTALDTLGLPLKDKAFETFAAIAGEARWNAHVKALPVFSSMNRYYHDVRGKTEVDKNAKYFLLGKPFVDGEAPFAERDGKIYNEVVCYPLGNFTNWVFVEDPAAKAYTLVELITADQDLQPVLDHTLFVDPQGNLYEGVAKDDGYRIYEWKLIK
jgi:hypothetical protein